MPENTNAFFGVVFVCWKRAANRLSSGTTGKLRRYLAKKDSA